MEILFEDNHLIVAYKPKEYLSQADGSDLPDMLTLIKEYIKEKYAKPNAVYLGLVHRLDINTSGVMVFARTSKAAARLSEDIKNHRFEKRYLAKVEGKLEIKKGVLEHKLLKDEKTRKAIVDKKGLNAVLEYEVIEEKKDYSIVDIKLKTGRFHQIRCQFSAIGHPLFGDVKYGSKHKVSPLEFPLEAYQLGFYHPISKEFLVFTKKTI